MADGEEELTPTDCRRTKERAMRLHKGLRVSTHTVSVVACACSISAASQWRQATLILWDQCCVLWLCRPGSVTSSTRHRRALSLVQTPNLRSKRPPISRAGEFCVGSAPRRAHRLSRAAPLGLLASCKLQAGCRLPRRTQPPFAGIEQKTASVDRAASFRAICVSDEMTSRGS